jgi:hypothetical protein
MPEAMTDIQSIPVRPQTRLFVANLFIQPVMTALFGWLTVGADGWGTRLFMASLALVTASLFVFSALVVLRTRGRTFSIEIGRETLTVPQPLRGTTTTIAWSSVARVTLHETVTAGTSFWAMNIHHDDRDAERVTVLSSQLIGNDAFDALRDALMARGLVS